ncbi:nuclear transport factor 2 family protein [Hydromonas duriensis]|uniref:SnoaL-like protein n=1 Tax=Hydromonas duriensis TaxID=1527608 RepID=A0A4R6Y0C7_9BURK|nr:nuclear transport factor 2 family protein [Hydromonas duriensis]TDR27840.1 SnoaL-like protein [Hydromonas duriensis]
MKTTDDLMQQRLHALLAWYSGLQAHTVCQAGDFYAVNARFKDPFNDVIGVANIVSIFDHMFTTTNNPRFLIDQRIIQHQQAFVTWTFEFELRGRLYQIVGGSHFVFNDDGLVVLHRDYWDAAEELLQKLPVVGAPIRWLRKRFALPQASVLN